MTTITQKDREQALVRSMPKISKAFSPAADDFNEKFQVLLAEMAETLEPFELLRLQTAMVYQLTAVNSKIIN